MFSGYLIVSRIEQERSGRAGNSGDRFGVLAVREYCAFQPVLRHPQMFAQHGLHHRAQISGRHQVAPVVASRLTPTRSPTHGREFAVEPAVAVLSTDPAEKDS